MKPLSTYYRLNSDNIISEVSDTWDRFACENDGDPGAIQSSVLHKSIFDAIQGDETRLFVDILLTHARTLQKRLVRPYRCDTPLLRRYMAMELVPEKDGHILVQHHLLKFHNQQAPTITCQPTAMKNLLKRCSICARIRVNDQWQEPSELAPPLTDITVFYGICPDCKS
ncbi:hypothetical protein [Desulfurispira natronophila]|uniref:Uncharacterized protein n=1 Tax=Desulfurispira natronophila TaxID=682562 RepID=A0A7W7Y2B3_9BACT|nr:hypothetical protein [Desulfurispira natronophila]MBB5020781.1 hypothetical protein [Desulfurispira natronophila]